MPRLTLLLARFCLAAFSLASTHVWLFGPLKNASLKMLRFKAKFTVCCKKQSFLSTFFHQNSENSSLKNHLFKATCTLCCKNLGFLSIYENQKSDVKNIYCFKIFTKRHVKFSLLNHLKQFKTNFLFEIIFSNCSKRSMFWLVHSTFAVKSNDFNQFWLQNKAHTNLIKSKMIHRPSYEPKVWPSTYEAKK